MPNLLNFKFERKYFFIFLKFLFLSFAYKKVDSFFYKIAFPEIKKLYCQIFLFMMENSFWNFCLIYYHFYFSYARSPEVSDWILIEMREEVDLLGKKSLRINQLDIKDEDLCLRIGTKENWRRKKTYFELK